VAPVVGDGPLYYTLADYVKYCENSYWTDLLFYSNFRDVVPCTGWTWYVNVDMQLFLLGLLLLAIYVQKWRYSQLLAKFVGLAVIVGTVIYVFVQCQIHNYRTFTGNDDDQQNLADYQTKIYLKPWSRAAPYLLGVFAGIFYYNFQEAAKKRRKVWADKLYRWRLVRIASTVLGLFLMGMYIYAPYRLLNGEAQWAQLDHSLYLATGHLGFTLGMLLMLLPMLLGYPNPIQTFLEVELLQLMAKLSFSSYMIHYILLTVMACAVVTDQYISPWQAFIYGCSDIVIVLICGFLVFVTV